MKREFLTFVIGVLIGAIIATGVFIVLESNNSSSNGTDTSMEAPSGDMPSDMGGGDFDPNSVGGEMPDDMGNLDSSNSTAE